MGCESGDIEVAMEENKIMEAFRKKKKLESMKEWEEVRKISKKRLKDSGSKI